MAVKKMKNKKENQKEKAVVNDDLLLVKEITTKLFKLMGIKSKPEISEDKENEAILVDIKTDEEAGLLIGNRGETIDSIQSILGMIFRQKTTQWKRIIVNVADWREKQKNRLSELANQVAERARMSGEPQPLYNLNPGQRREIHLALSEEKDIETESLGEGKERYLVVKPKEK